jgi:putative hydrolase of the HAD superfamily
MESKTGAKEIDVLLFDLGGVLVDFAGFEELGRLVPKAPSREEIRSRWIESETVQRFERGHISPAQFARHIIVEFGLQFSPQEFIDHFIKWARGPYPGSFELLGRISGEYKIASLSNSNELHTPHHRRSLEHLIGTFYFSDEIGHVKPERAIFDHVVDDLAVSPEKIAFFDDTKVNVDTARELGLRAYRVDGIDALRTQLECLGVLAPSTK